MQFSSAKKKSGRGKHLLIVLAIIAVLALLVMLAIRLLRIVPESTPVATKLPCPISDQVKPFGKYILYYDGLSLHCITESGSVRWSFQIGSNGGYDCDEEHVAAWSGPNLYVIDKNGDPSYNDNLGEDVQFARIGQSYVGAVVGENTTPRLLIKDLLGSSMDEESEAYSNLILLDLGFFGSSGQYMWTLALDVFGTAANTILNTFEVGQMNTGETSLGEPITYEVFFDNDVLRVINTRKMRTFSERGTEDTSAARLVYGWQYIDRETPSRGYARILFAPSSEVGSGYSIKNLRYLQGNTTDKRYTVPDSCIGALIYNGSVYAVSATTLYRASPGETRFTTWDLPLQDEADEYFGKLSSGSIIIAAGDAMYSLTLPK